jgi:hypothetical protein
MPNFLGPFLFTGHYVYVTVRKGIAAAAWIVESQEIAVLILEKPS